MITQQNLKRQEAERTLQKEQAIAERIFQEKPEVEQNLFDAINHRDGTSYTSNDYDKFPFLRSKILILLKKQFNERFV